VSHLRSVFLTRFDLLILIAPVGLLLVYTRSGGYWKRDCRRSGSIRSTDHYLVLLELDHVPHLVAQHFCRQEKRGYPTTGVSGPRIPIFLHFL